MLMTTLNEYFDAINSADASPGEVIFIWDSIRPEGDSLMAGIEPHLVQTRLRRMEDWVERWERNNGYELPQEMGVMKPKQLASWFGLLKLEYYRPVPCCEGSMPRCVCSWVRSWWVFPEIVEVPL